MELDLLGLCVNFNQFKHLLVEVDFDCTVDHLTLTYIVKSKTKPASTRSKRLLEVLSAYPCDLSYMKGKDMIVKILFPE